jgi:hypothetical protein
MQEGARLRCVPVGVAPVQNRVPVSGAPITMDAWSPLCIADIGLRRSPR